MPAYLKTRAQGRPARGRRDERSALTRRQAGRESTRAGTASQAKRLDAKKSDGIAGARRIDSRTEQALRIRLWLEERVWGGKGPAAERTNKR